ncbi:hypothetical protein CFP56_015395 [Quercus suber]|uniref:IMS import disulfide relay-system CHCH-CHCH-like Cx9C domain-containing protein n=1 Tax=Quercus suber TaxID=58331 RepID=A0AAW0KTX8_QUESU
MTWQFSSSSSTSTSNPRFAQRTLDMKERNSTSTLKRILVNCSAQAKEYGGCVVAKVPEVERDMCLKEFLALKTCMLKTCTLSA